jgi:hypothetical protein
MHDVYAYTQRERQIERVNRDATESPKKILDLTNFLNQLRCKSSQVRIFTSVADSRSDTRSIRRRSTYFQYSKCVGAREWRKDCGVVG